MVRLYTKVFILNLAGKAYSSDGFIPTYLSRAVNLLVKLAGVIATLKSLA